MVQDNRNPYAVNPLSSALPSSVAPVTFPRWALLGSLLVMLPWPILGMGACWQLSLFETSSEAVFMFGGVTMIFLLPLGLFVSSEWIFGVLIGLVWLIVLLLPLWFGKNSNHPGFYLRLMLFGQSLFSAIQAGLGFLMILGKQC